MVVFRNSNIFATMGCALGASLQNTVNKVIGSETKRFRHSTRGDSVVAAELRATVDAEEADMAMKRVEFQECLSQDRDKRKAANELLVLQNA